MSFVKREPPTAPDNLSVDDPDSVVIGAPPGLDSDEDDFFAAPRPDQKKGKRKRRRAFVKGRNKEKLTKAKAKLFLPDRSLQLVGGVKSNEEIVGDVMKERERGEEVERVHGECPFLRDIDNRLGAKAYSRPPCLSEEEKRELIEKKRREKTEERARELQMQMEEEREEQEELARLREEKGVDDLKEPPPPPIPWSPERSDDDAENDPIDIVPSAGYQWGEIRRDRSHQFPKETTLTASFTRDKKRDVGEEGTRSGPYVVDGGRDGLREGRQRRRERRRWRGERSEGDELAEQDPEEVSQWRNQVQASWGAQTQHVHHQDPYYDDGDRWAMDVAPERLYERNAFRGEYNDVVDGRYRDSGFEVAPSHGQYIDPHAFPGTYARLPDVRYSPMDPRTTAAHPMHSTSLHAPALAGVGTTAAPLHRIARTSTPEDVRMRSDDHLVERIPRVSVDARRIPSNVMRPQLPTYVRKYADGESDRTVVMGQLRAPSRRLPPAEAKTDPERRAEYVQALLTPRLTQYDTALQTKGSDSDDELDIRLDPPQRWDMPERYDGAGDTGRGGYTGSVQYSRSPRPVVSESERHTPRSHEERESQHRRSYSAARSSLPRDPRRDRDSTLSYSPYGRPMADDAPNILDQQRAESAQRGNAAGGEAARDVRATSYSAAPASARANIDPAHKRLYELVEMGIYGRGGLTAWGCKICSTSNKAHVLACAQCRTTRAMGEMPRAAFVHLTVQNQLREKAKRKASMQRRQSRLSSPIARKPVVEEDRPSQTKGSASLHEPDTATAQTTQVAERMEQRHRRMIERRKRGRTFDAPVVGSARARKTRSGNSARQAGKNTAQREGGIRVENPNVRKRAPVRFAEVWASLPRREAMNRPVRVPYLPYQRRSVQSGIGDGVIFQCDPLNTRPAYNAKYCTDKTLAFVLFRKRTNAGIAEVHHDSPESKRQEDEPSAEASYRVGSAILVNGIRLRQIHALDEDADEHSVLWLLKDVRMTSSEVRWDALVRKIDDEHVRYRASVSTMPGVYTLLSSGGVLDCLASARVEEAMVIFSAFEEALKANKLPIPGESDDDASSTVITGAVECMEGQHDPSDGSYESDASPRHSDVVARQRSYNANPRVHSVTMDVEEEEEMREESEEEEGNFEEEEEEEEEEADSTQAHHTVAMDVEEYHGEQPQNQDQPRDRQHQQHQRARRRRQRVAVVDDDPMVSEDAFETVGMTAEEIVGPENGFVTPHLHAGRWNCAAEFSFMDFPNPLRRLVRGRRAGGTVRVGVEWCWVADDVSILCGREITRDALLDDLSSDQWFTVLLGHQATPTLAFTDDGVFSFIEKAERVDQFGEFFMDVYAQDHSSRGRWYPRLSSQDPYARVKREKRPREYEQHPDEENTHSNKRRRIGDAPAGTHITVPSDLTRRLELDYQRLFEHYVAAGLDWNQKDHIAVPNPEWRNMSFMRLLKLTFNHIVARCSQLRAETLKVASKRGAHALPSEESELQRWQEQHPDPTEEQRQEIAQRIGWDAGRVGEWIMSRNRSDVSVTVKQENQTPQIDGGFAQTLVEALGQRITNSRIHHIPRLLNELASFFLINSLNSELDGCWVQPRTGDGVLESQKAVYFGPFPYVSESGAKFPPRPFTPLTYLVKVLLEQLMGKELNVLIISKFAHPYDAMLDECKCVNVHMPPTNKQYSAQLFLGNARYVELRGRDSTDSCSAFTENGSVLCFEQPDLEDATYRLIEGPSEEHGIKLRCFGRYVVPPDEQDSGGSCA